MVGTWCAHSPSGLAALVALHLPLGTRGAVTMTSNFRMPCKSFNRREKLIFIYFRFYSRARLAKNKADCLGASVESRGPELYTRCAWAGGTFFLVALLCQFFGCGGK